MGSNGPVYFTYDDICNFYLSPSSYILVKNYNKYKVMRIDSMVVLQGGGIEIFATNTKSKTKNLVYLLPYKDKIITKVDKKYKINKKTLDLLYT